MSDKVLNLDFLLEPVKPAGVVVLLGVEYELFRADIMENFLTLVALTERASAEVAADAAAVDDAEDPGVSAIEKVARLTERVDRLRADLRGMIRVLVPGLSDAILREKFPKMEQLQGLFSTLLIEVQKGLPESVKKNSVGTGAGVTD